MTDLRAGTTTAAFDPEAVPAGSPLAAIIDRGLLIVDQGPSPLDYSPSTRLTPNRLAIVDLDAGPASSGEYGYADITRRTWTSPTTGRRLKKPRIEIDRGAAAGTVCFVDWSLLRADWLYVHYMRVRNDHRHQGLATANVLALAALHTTATTIDFGKLMNPEADAVRQRVAAALPQHHIRYKRFY